MVNWFLLCAFSLKVAEPIRDTKQGLPIHSLIMMAIYLDLCRLLALPGLSNKARQATHELRSEFCVTSQNTGTCWGLGIKEGKKTTTREKK